MDIRRLLDIALGLGPTYRNLSPLTATPQRRQVSVNPKACACVNFRIHLTKLSQYDILIGGMAVRKKQHFLIVGDWFVDNYWVCAPQRTTASSRTGEAHIRAMHNINSSVRALCGAGEIASVLALSDNYHAVTGIGHWNPGDTRHLRSLLFPKLCIGDNPYRVKPAISLSTADPDTLKRMRLVDLFPIFPADTSIGTNRVWRIFEHTLDGYRHRTRIDWIQTEQWPPTPSPRSLDALVKKIRASERSKKRPVTAVLVKDHAYGAVTDELIERLASEFDDVPWYVTSKRHRPEWFWYLPQSRVKLLLLPKEIASLEVDDKEIPVHNWLIDKAIPSRGALTILSSYTKSDFSPSKLSRASSANNSPFRASAIVAEHAISSTLAYLPKSRLGAIIETNEEPEDDEARYVPRASIFFAAAVHFASMRKTPKWSADLHSALTFARTWASEEKGRIKNPDDWPGNLQRLPSSLSAIDVDTFSWNGCVNQWQSAHRNLGVIEFDGTPRAKLDLWRAMTEINGLVAIGKVKRKLISDLCEELASFKRGKPDQSKSFYIGDRPGFGKSSLIAELAKSYKFDLVPIDVTEIHKADDLWEYFHRILTKHQQNPKTPILVFVDEANAEVQGQTVFGWFLRPIEGRQFHDRGETYVLPATVWIFTGTADMRDGSAYRNEQPLKASDFVSRLNKEPYYLGDDTSAGRALERVYVGALSIIRRFSDVKYVSRKVLAAFDQLGDACSMREIRNYVNDFSGVVGGRVTWENVGERLRQRVGEPVHSDDPDVEIVLRASDAKDWHSPCIVHPKVERTKPPTTSRQPRAVVDLEDDPAKPSRGVLL